MMQIDAGVEHTHSRARTEVTANIDARRAKTPRDFMLERCARALRRRILGQPQHALAPQRGERRRIFGRCIRYLVWLCANHRDAQALVEQCLAVRECRGFRSDAEIRGRHPFDAGLESQGLEER